MSPVLLALLLTTAAGLSTTLGAVLVFIVGRPGPRFMAFALGFAAGVMLLVSFASLLPTGIEELGPPLAYLAFFVGIAAMFALDFVLPHSYEGIADHAPGGDPADPKLLRLGLFVALGVGLHNFPEGMATFVGTLADPKLGIAIAVAIALHNIPEGLAVAAPVYAATGSRGQAFLWSFLSGLAEPVGAGLAALVLLPFLQGPVLAGVVAFVAGLMVFISLDELLPAAREHGEAHLSILGTTAGMAVMALSLWLLG
jgi:ZIP family zinc transporter